MEGSAEVEITVMASLPAKWYVYVDACQRF